MDLVLTILGIYLLLGVLALCFLDMLTGRIRSRIKAASYQTQNKLMFSGTFISLLTAVILTGLALWIFWPVAIYGAIRG